MEEQEAQKSLCKSFFTPYQGIINANFALKDLESKDYGLLYRMLDDGKRVTRSSVKKMKLVEAERECLQAVSPQPSGSFEKTLTMNCAGMCVSEIFMIVYIIFSSHVKWVSMNLRCL